MPRIASVAASITVALIWRSYWALLVGILTNRVLRLVLSYAMHPFRPRLALSAWRHLLGYSSWSWVLALMSILRDKTPTILIGRMLGATQVGLFSLGFELASLPTTELVEPLTRAAFSAFSATRHHALEAGETYVRMVSAMALLTIPSGIGITLIADPVVRLAFGPHWTGAVPVVQLLGLCGALTVFGALSNSAFRVYGEMRLIFRVSMVVEAVRIVLLLWLTWRYGLMGAAVATSAAFAVEQVYFLILTQARFAIASRLLAGRLWRIFAATMCMAAVLRWTGAATALPVGAGSGALAVQAAGAALLGAVTYGASLLVLWLASGRAPGAEADLLRMVRRAARPVFARWRPA
jgi:O-antigen/teichoic acid export membrane protein